MGVKIKATGEPKLNGRPGLRKDPYYLPTLESLSLFYVLIGQFYSRWSGLSSRTVKGKPVNWGEYRI